MKSYHPLCLPARSRLITTWRRSGIVILFVTTTTAFVGYTLYWQRYQRLVCQRRITQQFHKIPGIHFYNLQQLLLGIKKCPSSPLGCGRKETPPPKWITNSWFLLHNNAPAHRSVFDQGFYSNNNMTMLEHSPFSPHLAPADFYLFPGPKSALKGRCFGDATDIIKNATEELKRLLQNGFQECFQQLDSRWQKYTFGQENYFEIKVAKVIVLFYIVLSFIVLIYIVLSCIVWFYIVLIYIVWPYIVLYCTVLQYLILYCLTLYCFILYCLVLFNIVLSYIVLFYIVLSFIVLIYIVLFYIVLSFIVLIYIVLYCFIFIVL